MISDYQAPIDDNMSGGGLSGEMLQHLRTAGKWGRFLALTGMIFLGFFIVMLLTMGSAGIAGLLMAAEGAEGAAGMAGFGTGLLIFYFAFIAFGFYLYYLLYRFSVDAIKTADDNDQVAAARSFKALGTLFKIIGIITAVYLVFAGLSIVAMFFGGFIGGM